MSNIEKLILDTHILIWYVEGQNGKLLDQQIQTIETARTNNRLYISAITIWEIAMLVNKEKIILSIPLKEWVDRLLSIDGLKVIELSTAILIESCNLPHYHHKDPADRFIIASARETNSHLMTYDQKILDYANTGYLKIA